jgi:hypothetical protein
MASLLKVDALTGVTTAGSISVTGEGNSTTTNLQQGLAKLWINFNGTGTIAARDSFNFSGLTDNGTGDYTVTLSNAMSSADYVALATCGLDSGGSRAFCSTDSHATTSFKVLLRQAASNNNIDAADVQSGLLGDLA